VTALVESDVAAAFGKEEEPIVYVFWVDDRPAYFEPLCLVGRFLKLCSIDLNVICETIALKLDSLSKQGVDVGLLIVQALCLSVWGSVLGLELLEQQRYSNVLYPLGVSLFRW